jgi:hypothetical protein
LPPWTTRQIEKFAPPCATVIWTRVMVVVTLIVPLEIRSNIFVSHQKIMILRR